MRIVAGAAPAVPRSHLRRDDQGRAPAPARQASAGAARHRLPLRHQRGRGRRRPHPGDLRQAPHAGGLRPGRRALPRGRAEPQSDLRHLQPLDHASPAIGICSRPSSSSTWSAMSPRSSTRSASSSRAARGCWSCPWCRSSSASSTRRPWPIRGRIPTRAWTACSRMSWPSSAATRPQEDRCAIFARVWELTEAASEAPPSDPFALVATGVPQSRADSPPERTLVLLSGTDRGAVRSRPRVEPNEAVSRFRVLARSDTVVTDSPTEVFVDGGRA